VTFSPIEFSGIVTLGGTEIMPALKPVRSTTTPPGPAGALSNTERIPGDIKRSSGFGVSVICIALTAVIVTVTGVLLVTPSFTISCAMYVPATSGTNVGVTVFAARNVELLPAGRLVNDQE
jgi:hypothetical protein